MSGLDELRQHREVKKSRTREAPQPAAKQSRRERKTVPVVDLDSLPSGYDPDLWDLTLFFEQRAEEARTGLAAKRLVIYARLQRRIGSSSVAGRDDMVAVVKDMMTSFWDDDVYLASARYALNQFCDVEYFDDLAGWVLHRRRPVGQGEWRGIEKSERGQERRRRIREKREQLPAPDDWDKVRAKAAVARARIEAQLWGDDK